MGGEQTRDFSSAVAARHHHPAQARTAKPGTVWSNMNSWEVLPGVARPMSWSLVNSHVKSMFRPLLRVLGIDFDKQPLFGLVAGRAYANVGTFTAISQALPVPGGLDFMQGLGGQHGNKLYQELVEQQAGQSRKRTCEVARWAKVWRLGPRACRRSAKQAAIWTGFAVICTISCPCRWRRSGTSSWSTKFMRLAPERAFRNRRGGGRCGGHGLRAFLFDFCKKKLGPDGDAMANRLLEGLGGLASAEAGLELWELALDTTATGVVGGRGGGRRLRGVAPSADGRWPAARSSSTLAEIPVAPRTSCLRRVQRSNAPLVRNAPDDVLDICPQLHSRIHQAAVPDEFAHRLAGGEALAANAAAGSATRSRRHCSTSCFARRSSA